MKKFTTILFLTLVLISCKKESLESYLVESQKKQGFITVDVPISFLQLKSDDLPEDVKKTLQTIKKINLVALPIKNSKIDYATEKERLKSILNNTKEYKRLMSFSDKGKKIILYYAGVKDAIEEIIAFGYSNEIGVGVARLLGDEMNPTKIIEMIKNIKFDKKNINLKQFSVLFDKKSDK